LLGFAFTALIVACGIELAKEMLFEEGPENEGRLR